MKILHFISNRWNSAITEYALSVVNSLNRVQTKNVFCPVIGTPAERRANSYGVNLNAVKSFGLLGIKEVYTAVDRHRPDKIICYGGPESTLIQILIKTKILDKNIRFIRFRGNDIDSDLSGIKLWRYRVSSHGNDLVITPSHALATKHTKLCQNSFVKTVALGCDSEKFRFKYQWKSHSRPQIIVVGRLDPVKGHARALKIFRLLLDAWQSKWGLPPLLHIVGEPANLSEQDIITRINESQLKIDRDILLTTRRVPDIESMMSCGAVGFVPSINSELICRVAQEFLLCGTPVFVSGVGSLNEVLLNESFGDTYYQDSDEIASQKLLGLLRQSILESEVHRANRSALANSFFSWDAMAKSLIDILEKL